MYKEILNITKNHVIERIDELNKCLDILNSTEQDANLKLMFKYAISELEQVKNVIFNACDYGEYLKEHGGKI